MRRAALNAAMLHILRRRRIVIGVDLENGKKKAEQQNENKDFSVMAG